MRKLLTIILAITGYLTASSVICNGIQWHDENGRPVSAHGANIVFDNGKYWLFGEYKTDSANVFTGFSCYSSENLTDWHFERIVLSTQPNGIMGPNRVGERPKVLRCPSTGEYIMLIHSDNLRYKEPCVAYATSPTINGKYTFRGPLLYKGKTIRKWDIGSFVDDDGTGYLLVHHGHIYRLSDDYHSVDSCLINGLTGSGESPAMFKKDGVYYWLSSHTTSWERNDNMYHTATSINGPWTFRGSFAPEGSLTWNSQCSFVLSLPDGTPMYMGDRWSFPRQHTAATYVWLPLTTDGYNLSIPEYWQFWDPATINPVTIPMTKIADGWTGNHPGDTHSVAVKGGRVAICGETNDHSAYADICITAANGDTIVNTCVDFYSLVAAEDVRYISPKLPDGNYTLTVTVSEMKSNWSDKKRNKYGSKGYMVKITKICSL